MRRAFVDTTVLTLATGDEHLLREPCRAIVELAARGELVVHVSTEAIQEFAFHRMRRADRSLAVSQSREVAAMCRVHAFDIDVLEQSLSLVASAAIRGRDAVHAATAIIHGFDSIVTADRDFDGIPGLRRIDPTDALA